MEVHVYIIKLSTGKINNLLPVTRTARLIDENKSTAMLNCYHFFLFVEVPTMEPHGDVVGWSNDSPVLEWN